MLLRCIRSGTAVSIILRQGAYSVCLVVFTSFFKTLESDRVLEFSMFLLVTSQRAQNTVATLLSEYMLGLLVPASLLNSITILFEKMEIKQWVLLSFCLFVLVFQDRVSL